LTVPKLTGVTVTVQSGCVGAKKLRLPAAENCTRVVVGGATGGVMHAESLSITIDPWSMMTFPLRYAQSNRVFAQ
jgi:hypothetical protein